LFGKNDRSERGLVALGGLVHPLGQPLGPLVFWGNPKILGLKIRGP